MLCPKQLQTTLQLSDFQFVRAIGHGYASTVFEAIHISSKLHCVIKVCMKTRIGTDDSKRMRREIKNHAYVSHRHILTFYAAFEDSTAFYLVLEHAEHGDLYKFIKRNDYNNIPLHRFLAFILQPLLHAVAYLHSNHIIHRDIKPENILIDSTNIIRLCDFGMSIHFVDERPHSVVGTLEYMPPEILLRNTKYYSEKIDIWAIGVLTYECLVGHSPFADKTEAQIRKNILERRIDLSKVQTPLLQDFISICLQLQPENRPSIQELLNYEMFHPLIQQTRVAETGRRARSFSF
jgi:aurora kinase, other